MDCTVAGCTRPILAKGLCATHRSRLENHGSVHAGWSAYDKGTPTFEDRFWSRVDRTDGCWLWTGAMATAGYGQIREKRRTLAAHRVSYEMHYGPIPAGLEVCHSCDARACVRPDHLFLGSHRENMLDASRKGRMVGNGGIVGEAHKGSKLTVPTVRDIRTSDEPARILAERHGVHIATIYRVRWRKSWKAVA